MSFGTFVTVAMGLNARNIFDALIVQYGDRHFLIEERFALIASFMRENPSMIFHRIKEDERLIFALALIVLLHFYPDPGSADYKRVLTIVNAGKHMEAGGVVSLHERRIVDYFEFSWRRNYHGSTESISDQSS